MDQATHTNHPVVSELLRQLLTATETDVRLEAMKSFFAPRTPYNVATDRDDFLRNSPKQIAVATAAAQTVYGHSLVHESTSSIGRSAIRHFDYEYEVFVRRMGLPYMIVNSTDAHWIGYAEYIKRNALRILSINKFDSPWLNWQVYVEKFGLGAIAIDDPAAFLLRSGVVTLRAEFPLATFVVSDGYEREHAAMSMGLAQLQIDALEPATAIVEAGQQADASLNDARVSLRLPAFTSCACDYQPDVSALLSARADCFDQSVSMNARITASGGLQFF